MSLEILLLAAEYVDRRGRLTVGICRRILMLIVLDLGCAEGCQMCVELT